MRIVFDDQQYGLAGFEILAVVGNLLDRAFCHACSCQHCRSAHARSRSSRSGGYRSSRIDLRQIQSKGASLPGSASQLNLPAQQAGQFAADGQSQSGSPVLAARAGVGLLEGFEDNSLLLLRNANAGIGNFKGNHRYVSTENRVILAPTLLGDRDRESYPPALGELKCIRQQVLEYLL